MVKLTGVVVSEESYHSEDPCDVVYSNICYLNALLEEYFSFEEVSEDALTSYYVDYYLAQVNNGGFVQFIDNSEWSKTVIDYVQKGLIAIGAKENLALFSQIAHMVETLGEDNFRGEMRNEYILSDQDFAAFDELASTFYLLQDTENLSEYNGNWLKRHPQLEVLNEADYENKIKTVAQLIPNRAEREQQARAAEPRYLKQIRALCAQSGQDFERVTAGDPRHKYNEKRTFAWHFLTNKGHHYMIENEDKALMFNGKTEVLLLSIPMLKE